MKILFVTDLHGSRWKYDRLLELAKHHRVTAVINGGDVLPKEGDLFEQDKFITGYLKNHFAGFNDALNLITIVHPVFFGHGAVTDPYLPPVIIQKGREGSVNFATRQSSEVPDNYKDEAQVHYILPSMTAAPSEDGEGGGSYLYPTWLRGWDSSSPVALLLLRSRPPLLTFGLG
ncbi:MAG: hypothetical protein HYY44_02980 [Deltaproteobacteria bacterium]|nr:hypothetical protein [Deltaproteobacteria bacterium]